MKPDEFSLLILFVVYHVKITALLILALHLLSPSCQNMASRGRGLCQVLVGLHTCIYRVKSVTYGSCFMDYIDGERHVREGFIGRAFTGNLERLDPLTRGLQPPFLVGIYILRLCRYCTKEMRNTHAQCRASMNHGMTNDKVD